MEAEVIIINVLRLAVAVGFVVLCYYITMGE